MLGSCAPEIDQEIEPLNGSQVSAQQGRRVKSRQRSGGLAHSRRGKRASRRIWYADGRKESVLDSDARSQGKLDHLMAGGKCRNIELALVAFKITRDNLKAVDIVLKEWFIHHGKDLLYTG